MNRTAYSAYFRSLAEQHIDIAHSESNCAFLRITISLDPVQRMLDMSEFYNSLREKVSGHTPFLVLQSYDADYADNGGDHKTKRYHGAFLILQQAEADDFDGREAVLDRAERIGEELLARVLHDFNDGLTGHALRITADDITAEPVGPVGDNFHGIRFDFTFSKSANQALYHNPAQFNRP